MVYCSLLLCEVVWSLILCELRMIGGLDSVRLLCLCFFGFGLGMVLDEVR